MTNVTKRHLSHFICGLFLISLSCTGKESAVNSERTCRLHEDCPSMLCIEGRCYEEMADGSDMTSILDEPDAEQLNVTDDPLVRDMLISTADMEVIQDMGDMSSASEDMDLPVNNDFEVSTTCSVTCEETECEPLSCSCDDGRIVSSDACVDECCVSASGNEQLRAEVCTELCETTSVQCEFGEQRCLEEGGPGILSCNQDREWIIGVCPNSQVCALGQCLPNNCIDGHTICISANEFAVCNSGSWEVGESCQEACAQGRCQSTSCAQAIVDKSYLGCEFLTLELPNTTTYTNHSPTAVVLSNPSETEAAFIQILNHNGEATALINEQLIELPDIDDLPSIYTAQTIRSEIRDANHQVVENGVIDLDQIRIPAGGIGTFLLPPAQWSEEGSQIRQVAHRVISDSPISAQQFSPYCCNYSFSNDASLLLPTSTLGKNYRFIGVPTLNLNPINQEVQYPANTVIIATKDQTEISINLPSIDLIQPEATGRVTLNQGGYVVTLNNQETLVLKSSSREGNIFESIAQPDLTGTFIEASEPIAVFSGHECSFYPFNLRACDHLEEQLLPINTWGTEFLLIPPRERGVDRPFERTFWKILAEGSNANVNLSVPYSVLNAGGPGAVGVPNCRDLLASDGQTINLGTRGFCELSTKKAFGLRSDQKLTIMGVISGQDSVMPGSGFGSRHGDPSIFLVPSLHQLRSSYTFVTPTTYYTDFVTITFAEGTDLVLDGQVLNLDSALNIEGAAQKYIHVELEDGYHHLVGSQPFSIVVSAYDDFVSYSFLGGLNLPQSAEYMNED